MAIVFEETNKFTRAIQKIKDNSVKEQIKKQMIKIMENPEIGKPMKFVRRGTREVYVGSSRLSYSYIKNEGKLIFLDFYHKDKQ